MPVGASTAGDIDKLAPLNGMHGDGPYQAACSASGLQILKQTISDLTSKKEFDGAWQVVHTMLCGKGRKAEQFMMQHMPKRIASTDYQTGDMHEVKGYIKRSPTVLLKQQAWGVDAQRDGEFIRVSYLPNEACAGSFVLRSSGESWLLLAIGGACD